MVELQPYSIGILEQQRVISRRPLILARRANDLHVKRTQEAVQLVNVSAFAGAKTQMVQADAILLERGTGVLGRRRVDPDRRAPADAVITCLGIDDGLQPEKRQQLAVELTGAFEIRCGQKNMRDAVDFHRLPPSSPGQFRIKTVLGNRQHTAIGPASSSVMEPATRTGPRRGGLAAAALPLGLMLVAMAAGPAVAAGCSFEPQGEGRVAAVVDARTFRLQDGREVRLAGIAPVPGDHAHRASALAAILMGHDVTLSGEDDTPDRYGRQSAFVFLEGAEPLVQGLLLAQGEALVSPAVADTAC